MRESLSQVQKRYLIASLVLLAVIAVVIAAVLIFKGKQPQEKEVEVQVQKEEKQEKELMKVKLYFLDGEENVLVEEEKEIEKGKNERDSIRNLLSALFEGPSSPQLLSAVPEGTHLRQVYIIEHVCVVDLTGPIASMASDGSSAELLAIYSIVNSITANFPDVRSVKIILDGMERETLFGHVSLKDPFFPDMSYVASQQ